MSCTSSFGFFSVFLPAVDFLPRMDFVMLVLVPFCCFERERAKGRGLGLL